MGDFRKLTIWQDAISVVVEVYKLTKLGELERDFGLKDQMQRSAVSIPSNIAEGEESMTPKLSIRYFSISKASSAELITQLIIAERIGYISQKTREELEGRINKIAASIKKQKGSCKIGQLRAKLHQHCQSAAKH